MIHNVRHIARSTVFVLALFIASCTEHVGFVTNTRLGIGMDASTAKAHIAYSRDEFFVGPVYTGNGGIPPVLGTVISDGSATNATMLQTFVTGDAAILIANGKGSLKEVLEQRKLDCAGLTGDAKAKCEALSAHFDEIIYDALNGAFERQRCALNLGCDTKGRKTDIFSTQTDYGFVVQINPGTMLLSKINLGISRQEITLVPLVERPISITGSDGEKDIFPSQLALSNAGSNIVNSIADSENTTPKPEYGVAQVIATGAAADGIAADKELQNSIREQIRQTAKYQSALSKTAAELQKDIANKAETKAITSTSALNTAQGLLDKDNIENAKKLVSDNETEVEATKEANALILKLNLANEGDANFPDDKPLAEIVAWATSAKTSLIKWENELSDEANRPTELASGATTIGELRQRLAADKLLRKYASLQGTSLTQ